MEVSPLGKAKFSAVKLMQLWKAAPPMDVTLLGIVKLVIP